MHMHMNIHARGARTEPGAPAPATTSHRRPLPKFGRGQVGCIVAEMQRRAIVFPGTEARSGELQADQLHRLFRTLGMPRDELWPQGLPHWPTVQRWRAADYPDANALPSALGADCSPALLSLLRGLLRLNPACRCTAKDALAHPYWHDSPQPMCSAVDDDVGGSIKYK